MINSIRYYKSAKVTSQLLLPQHFREQLLMLVKEVGDLAVLVVALGRHEHSMFRLLGQVLADLWDREDDLLHGAVAADHLDLAGVLRVVFQCRVGLQFSADVALCRTQLIRHFLVVPCQLHANMHACTHYIHDFINLPQLLLCVNRKLISFSQLDWSEVFYLRAVGRKVL